MYSESVLCAAAVAGSGRSCALGTHGASEAHYAKATCRAEGQGESAAPAWPVVVGCDSRCMAGRHGAASLRAVARHHLVCEAEAEKSGAGPGHGESPVGISSPNRVQPDV
jgi:hypothetical protein